MHNTGLQTNEPRAASLLVNIASRDMPKTLEYLCQKKEAGDPTQALRAIARRDDVASISVLLTAGADPLAGVALTSALFDAAASGQAASVSEMLKHIDNRPSPKVTAAYEIAKKEGYETIAKTLLAAGAKPREFARPEPMRIFSRFRRRRSV